MQITMRALTPEQVENIHEMTLSLLQKHGVNIGCGEACETFAAHGARLDGEQVYIPPEMVEAAIKSTPASFTLHARNPEKNREIGIGKALAVSPVSGVPIILDGGQQRLVTFDDYKNMVRLAHTSPVVNVANSCSLYPTHKDAVHALYLQMYNTVKLTDLPLVGQTEGLQVSADCVELYKRACGMNDKTVAIGICNSLSPMAWDKTMLEGIRAYAEGGQAVNITCCSMTGATAPIYLFGSILEANAEVLAGLVYAQLLRPGTPVIYGTTSSIMDMMSMGLSLGTPEYSLISTGCAQMAAYYNVPFRSGGGLSDAKVPDAQAGSESALNLMISMNNGVNLMLQSLGVLEYYMAVSFEKWVMDEEIIRHISHIQKGMGEIPEDLEELIADGVANNFLEQEATFDNFRSELFLPMLKNRKTFEAWSADGQSYEDMAAECVQRRIEEYKCPDLGPDTMKDVRTLIQNRIGYDPESV